MPFETSTWEVDRSTANGDAGGMESGRRLMCEKSDGTGEASLIIEAVQKQQCAQPFGGFDDSLGRAERAAQMLHDLRSVGPWTLHIVHFPERFVQAHSAIICHPARLKNAQGIGGDIVAHLADKLCTLLTSALKVAKKM